MFWDSLERDISNSCFSDLMEKEWFTASCYHSDSQAAHGFIVLSSEKGLCSWSRQEKLFEWAGNEVETCPEGEDC